MCCGYYFGCLLKTFIAFQLLTSRSFFVIVVTRNNTISCILSCVFLEVFFFILVISFKWAFFSFYYIYKIISTGLITFDSKPFSTLILFCIVLFATALWVLNVDTWYEMYNFLKYLNRLFFFKFQEILFIFFFINLNMCCSHFLID